MPKIHTCSYRVCYADTDRMDRVYYANYFIICERARTEFLREIGHPYKTFEEKRNLFFPVRSCQARYYNYAVYDDELICRSHLEKLRHATITFITEISRKTENNETLLVKAAVELACVNENGKPHVIPEDMRQALLPYLAT